VVFAAVLNEAGFGTDEQVLRGSTPTGASVPISRSEKTGRLLSFVQVAVVAGILGLLALGVSAFGSVGHMTGETVTLSNIHHGSVSISEALHEWAVDHDGEPTSRPDLTGAIAEVRSGIESLRQHGGSDAAKGDLIESHLDSVLVAIGSLHEGDGLRDRYRNEVAPVVEEFTSVAREYWRDEIDELAESGSLVATTRRLLLFLGPLLVGLGWWSASGVMRLKRRADRVELAETLVRSKDDFLARVCHEIRTPLTGIVGFSEVLRDQQLDGAEASDLVASIAAQSAELAMLVEDLLTGSVAELREVSMNLSAIDLGDSVQTAVESFGLAPAMAVGDGEAYAIADPARVRQILRNLISNAVRHGGDDIAVDIFDRGTAAGIVVSDDGSAIAPDTVTRIFEPYTGRGGSESNPGGVGIGLTISRDLARRMGGDLTYRHSGGRSQFILTLPAGVAVEAA
jgi:signal transduction histidine kinase